MLSTDTWLKIICSMMANAVIFGTGAAFVLSIPELAVNAKYLIPAAVVVSFAAAPFVAALVAPRMRIRNWGKKRWREGDLISCSIAQTQSRHKPLGVLAEVEIGKPRCD